ncbi:hypothetical protein MTHERMMSTA1_07390 [Methanosarcina thermophila MST-A1]|nr:hypothetical protein MTHERMMSTA1_07390 [Methanosarcina thermophila MST-A1]
MSIKITGLFLIFFLLISYVAAQDLPTKEEITDFIAGIPVTDNYINTVYDAVVNNHPSWNCDIWKDKNGNQLLSLYYINPSSAKGYGSIYINEFGKEVSTAGVELKLVKSYVGETGSEVNNNNNNNNNNVQTPDETVQTGYKTTQTNDGNVQTDNGNIQTTDRTVNKDLPTKEEVTDFIASIPVTDNYINTVYDAVVNNHPSWNCDIWKDKNGNQLLSLYYINPSSAKGYGSIYFNEFGKEISTSGVKIEPVPIKSHVGKAAAEETTSVKTTPAKTTLVKTTPVKTTPSSTEEQLSEKEAQAVEEKTQTVGDERLAEYEERLAEYEERLAEYEEKQSVGYKQQIINTVQSIDGKDQSAEYEELLDEYKELLDVYKEAKKVGDVPPPTEPEETKWDKIFDSFFAPLVVLIIGTLICDSIRRFINRHWN